MLVVGYIPGTWDMLHAGHVIVLDLAKSMCDRLLVGVPCDDTVFEDKGARPLVALGWRLRVLRGLRSVDAAVPYYSLDFMPHLAMLRPDILFVGETWGRDERHVAAEGWVSQNNRKLIKMPYTKGISTTELKDAICREQ